MERLDIITFRLFHTHINDGGFSPAAMDVLPIDPMIVWGLLSHSNLSYQWE
jgi:hypothetical protein